MPNLHYESHHKICNLRYASPDYRINSYYKLEFSQFFISVFFLFQLINRPIVEITKINADVREKIPSVGYLENVEVRVPVDFWPR